MAAGLGFKTFTTGEVLTAADTNGYLMQGVLVFASAAARDAAITSPQEGQCCYLKDTDAVLTYSGAAWVGFDDSNAIQNSIVDAKGDLVAASGADTPARLAVGNNGETLVADSAATTGLRYSATPSASNPVLNSAMQVWQRGTSFAVSGSASYTADRWQAVSAAYTAGLTVSRQTTSDTTNLPNIQYCARVQRDSGNTSTAARNLQQNFESVNSIPFAGKTVTLSFYARAGANYSAASSALGVQWVWGTGTDQNNYLTGFTGGTNVSATLGVTLTTTWQRFTLTGTIGATATQICTLFYFSGVGTAGVNDYFEVTGVQMDIGSVALPFRTYAATIQGELAACQRYYEKSYDQATVPGTANSEKGQIFAPSGNAANGVQVCSIRYAVVKRSVPTITFYSYTGATAKLSDAGGTDLAANSAFTNNTAYGGNSGTRIYNNSGGTITAAFGGYEFHFVADSEL
jgi:hypothetical protein